MDHRLSLIPIGLLLSCDALADAPDDSDVFALARAAVTLSREEEATSVWPGMAELDEGFVIVTPDYETAYCFDAAPGFVLTTEIDSLDCKAHRRKRIFPQQIQASLNLFGAEETVMTSGPGALGQTLTDWQLLFIHERFHQWQSTLPDYAVTVSALDLAGDDDTGMWMLTYPFPYDGPAVNERFAELGRELARLFAAKELSPKDIDRYRSLREKAFATLSDAERRYAEFQLWKEGAARWTELAVADVLANSELTDTQRFAAAADARRGQIQEILNKHSFASAQRGLFYALGAAEWELVERIDPTWRERYGDTARFVMDSALTGDGDCRSVAGC
ncbi:MAG: hypothetical protein AAGH76_00305 [Pseudomonadota bacterium]